MSMIDPTLLLDQPPLGPDELRELEQLVARTLGTSQDVVLVQAEAILALESVARSVAGPGRRVLNLVSGPYGGVMGEWMRQAGAVVDEIAAPFDEVLDADVVRTAIDATRPDVVAVVHAEAATGGSNPLRAILDAAHSAGALTIVDAVASIGAEPVEVDAWGIDVAALGAQKALAGPAGVSAVSVSARAWAEIDANAAAPRGSSLSLTDWRDRWLRTDRDLIPGMPSWLEARSLAAALRRVQGEGLSAVNERHRRAARAAAAGVQALGLSLWQRHAAGRAAVDTTVRPPDDVHVGAADVGGILALGDGALRGRLLRINHTGRAAALDPVLDALDRLAPLAPGDATEARQQARAAWDG
jgi:aspartate aminotransferase-like enzyme